MVYLRIDTLLKENNKTKYWLVKQMNSSYQTINKIFGNDTSSIRFDTIDKLCHIFNCKPGDLFEYKEES